MLDHYEILHVIGTGGMGIVLLARNTACKSEEHASLVAIKLLKSQFVNEPRAVQCFLREARLMRKLKFFRTERRRACLQFDSLCVSERQREAVQSRCARLPLRARGLSEESTIPSPITSSTICSRCSVETLV